MKSFKQVVNNEVDLSVKLDYDLSIQEGMGATTDNASITELFPCIAFNKGFKPSSVEDFKKFIYKLNLSTTTKSFAKSDADAAASLIERLPNMEERFVKAKLENAIGITNYLYTLNSSKSISKVVWGYRAKPSGVPSGHAGDIFVFFNGGDILGVSLKAGTKTSKEPLKNTYVGTQYKKLGISTSNLEKDLWNRVYSKLPNIKNIANASNYIKNKDVTKAYVDYYVENEREADKLYHEMLVVARENMCAVINKMDTPAFIEWCKETFNLQRKKEKIPLILVKAVGTTAEQKGDDIVDLLPLVTKHHAYLNTNSVQEYFIAIYTPTDRKALKMTIRSDSGVRPEKGTSGQGRLGQYLQLKMQYSGTIG